jgi:hypothetical protein
MAGGEGEPAQQRWPGVPTAGSWRRLTPGAPFGAITGPFPKVTDDAIEAERAALSPT